MDPSTTRFGFAFGNPEDAKPKTGVWRFPGADEAVFNRTLGLALDNVAMMCRVTGATHVVIEAPIIITDRSAHTMVALMQLAGAVRAAAVRAKCDVRLVASSTVRKHFVGHGRPENPKRAVMERCKLLGWDFEDDNAADACATWSWGVCSVYQGLTHTPMFAKVRAA